MKLTEYMLPNGRQKLKTVYTTPELEIKAAEMDAKGVYFDFEILRTGQASITAEREDEEGEAQVLSHKICENTPGVIAYNLGLVVVEAYSLLMAKTT